MRSIVRVYNYISDVSEAGFSGRLHNLGLRRRRQLGAKDTVPETAGHAEAVLVVGEVVLQVVLLEFAPVGWEAVEDVLAKGSWVLIAWLHFM